MPSADVFGFACVLLVNGLAGATTLIGGVRTGDIARLFRTFADPAPFAFAIWSLVYLLTLFFIACWSEAHTALFLGVCAVNCLWLVTWGWRFFVPAAFLLVAYAVLLFQLWLTRGQLSLHLGQIAISVHFGWVLCANTVSIPLSIGFVTGRLVPAWLTALLLAGLAGMSFFLQDVYICFVVVWALFAIRHMQMQRIQRKVTDGPSSKLIVQTCQVLMALLVVLIFVLLLWWKKY